MARTTDDPGKAKPAQPGARSGARQSTVEAKRLPKHPSVSQLSSRHRRTLELILEEPTRSDFPWSDIESLITALGGRIASGRGARRRIFLVRPAVFHIPRTDSITDRGAVKDMREYLRSVGVWT